MAILRLSCLPWGGSFELCLLEGLSSTGDPVTVGRACDSLDEARFAASGMPVEYMVAKAA